MARKQLAALAALMVISTPSVAFELKDTSPGVKFYYSIPLDARNAKEQAPSYGMVMRGSRPYEVVNLNSRMMNSFLPLGGLEVKWIVAGVVATGAVAAVATKDKKASQSYQQQQQQQIQNGAEPPCPVQPVEQC